MDTIQKFNIPYENHLIKKTLNEVYKFAKTIQYSLAEKHKVTYSESLAFRLIASIDWSKTNLDDFKKDHSPLLTWKHLDLESLLVKKHCSYMRFKEAEVKSALYLWSNWRTRLSRALINIYLNDMSNTNDFNSLFNSQSKTNALIENDDDLIALYTSAKWSSDDSSLKYGTFLHYGIPRAKLRTMEKLTNIEETIFSESVLSCHSPDKINQSFFSEYSNQNKTYDSNLSQSIQHSYVDQSVKDESETRHLNSSELKNEKTYDKHESRNLISNLTGDSGINDTSSSPSKLIYYRGETSNYRGLDEENLLVDLEDNQMNFSPQSLSSPHRSFYYRRRNSPYNIPKQKKRSLIIKSSGSRFFGSISKKSSGSLNKSGTENYRSCHSVNDSHSFISYNDSSQQKSLATRYDNSLAVVQKENNSTIQTESSINKVKGGLVTNIGNVYFPTK